MTACGHRAGTGPAVSGHQPAIAGDVLETRYHHPPPSSASPLGDGLEIQIPHPSTIFTCFLLTSSIYWSLGNKLLRTRGKYGALSHFVYNLSRKICRDFRHFGIIKADVAGERLRGQLSIRETKKMLILFHLVNTTKQITLQRNKSL